MAPATRQPAFSSPALRRGVALLDRLNRHGPAGLDQLARATGFPKTSVARLLDTLVDLGLVVRDEPSRTFRAAMALQPIDGPHAALRRICNEPLQQLCQAACHTVELHAWDGRRLMMIDRREPEDAVVRALARVGWQRDLDEFDALTQLVVSFTDPAAEPAAHLWYWHEGRRKRVGQPRLASVPRTVRRRRVAVDLGVNTHGVRRYAAPLLNRDGQLVAAIAIAEAVNPHRPQVSGQLRRLVADAARLIGTLNLTTQSAKPGGSS